LLDACIAPDQFIWFSVTMFVAGTVTGVLAGLFGIGGGTVVVPVLYEVFGLFGISDDVRMQLCVGTSLAVIVPTSISSFIRHHERGAVDMAVLRAWIGPVVLGAIVGSCVASHAPIWVFKFVFVGVAVFTAARLLEGANIRPVGSTSTRGAKMIIFGGIIGVVSSLMGIGGGLLSNVVLNLYGRPIQQSIATSSGIGVLISVPAAVGYAIAGWGRAGLPPLSIGFVSGLGVILLMPMSLVSVGLGVTLAHRLPKRHLEYTLCLYLALISARFLS
jgi:uncharacterized protein